MAAVLFENSDQDYLEWIDSHPRGYVVNSRAVFDPDYIVLHRSSCGSVRGYPAMDTDPGGFTERSYIKICADSVTELQSYLKTHTRKSPPFSKRCALCKPL